MNKKNLKTITIVCLVLIIIYLMYLLIKLYKKFKKTNNSKSIPKIIWVYWDKEEKPKIVDYCIKKMYKLNPKWKINVLDKKNLQKYIDLDIFKLRHATTPARTSDMIRLEILSKYGGVWCDASIILTKSLDWIHDVQDKEDVNFIGFYIDGFTINKDYPIIENWFFACTKNNNFVKKWKEIFYKINEYNTVEEYVDDLKRKTDIQNISSPYYLSMHVAAQYILQNEMSIEERKKTMYLQKAEDGPFKYLVKNDWDSTKSIKYLCENQNHEYTPFIKLRGCERNAMENEDYLNLNI